MPGMCDQSRATAGASSCGACGACGAMGRRCAPRGEHAGSLGVRHRPAAASSSSAYTGNTPDGPADGAPALCSRQRMRVLESPPHKGHRPSMMWRRRQCFISFMFSAAVERDTGGLQLAVPP